jgi:hypothetical protein
MGKPYNPPLPVIGSGSVSDRFGAILGAKEAGHEFFPVALVAWVGLST